MPETFTSVETTIRKVSVTITRYWLWKNYVENWGTDVWRHNERLPAINAVSSVLTGNGRLTVEKLNQLFSPGVLTRMLMGDAMSVLDTGEEIHREILVVDNDGTIITVADRYINF